MFRKSNVVTISLSSLRPIEDEDHILRGVKNSLVLFLCLQKSNRDLDLFASFPGSMPVVCISFAVLANDSLDSFNRLWWLIVRRFVVNLIVIENFGKL